LRPIAQASLIRHGPGKLVLEPRDTHLSVSGGLAEKQGLAWASFRKALDDACSVPIPVDDPEILKEQERPLDKPDERKVPPAGPQNRL